MRFQVFHAYIHLRYGWCLVKDEAPDMELTKLDRIMYILCFGVRSYREMEKRNA